ncbi:MAG: hypothetical protein CSYNP_04194 [Syntrophus sp. SKADARSKE-3]|nr:hypothetical protein [Syntrophus sp. SKADARSKE-3]
MKDKPYIDVSGQTGRLRLNKRFIALMGKWIRITLVVLLLVPFASCKNQESKVVEKRPAVAFDAGTLKVPDRGARKVRGQVLYMPVYLNVPSTEKSNYDLSALLAIHNTDLAYRIKVTKVTLFNTDGKVVKQYITEDRLLEPFATAIFTIPRKDQSGTGANFLVEWIADQPVNEPLIESITKDVSGNLGLSFLSTGKVIREMK